ncbi:S8 family peptidase [Clostridium sp. M62/1]|uniref:S8 family peptidase n=1 Tax=Clostridium sp. M62/1 TaxID=411486 RepID=UPI0035627EE9
MNSILQLKGQFEQQSGNPGGGKRNLPVGRYVEAKHVFELIDDLKSLQVYWKKHSLIKGALISVYYTGVVAKSNRIRALLCKGASDPNDSIRGAKFAGDPDHIQHVFTYYVGLDVISNTIDRLTIVGDIIKHDYNGKIQYSDIEALNKGEKRYKYQAQLAKTNFVNAVVDAFYVQKFSVDFAETDEDGEAIVTLYKTDVKTEEIFRAIGIDYLNAKQIDENTILLRPDEIARLKENAPYLIAMKVRDLREIPVEDSVMNDSGVVQIPSPKQEPIIGVIDTPFSKDVYFKEWVTYENMLDENIKLDQDDYIHGTEVTSIIVDGPTINPALDDGCGRFRVKHFGVAKRGRFSSYSILRSIRKAVSQNRDIKVWNLSLGSILPIKPNFISPEAAELDKIQSEFDVVFVIAGTNGDSDKKRMAIGAPADSLNSLVVNSVTLEGMPASYHRVGPVLSFFHKPDISYYGGDIGQPMHVCAPTGENFVKGTSFSAPWISRKMAYLICTLGFSREVAKALIIDAAAGWDRKDDASCSIGYGIVPQRIEDIVKTPDDEIRFVMMGTTDAYETYTYRIPVPIYNDRQPFYARATLCYFPKCVRDQGVDYTTTEMDIHFGRVKEKGGKAVIASINSNSQGDDDGCHLHEPEARQLYRKWDNVKLISEELKDRAVPRKVYGAGMWGLSIKTKERLKEKNGRGLSFGVVVTLKEMYGENRIDDFIKLCMLRGWVVNRVDIENQIDIYNKAEEEIEF